MQDKNKAKELWDSLYCILKDQGIDYRYANKEKALIFALMKGLINKEEYKIMREYIFDKK